MIKNGICRNSRFSGKFENNMAKILGKEDIDSNINPELDASEIKKVCDLIFQDNKFENTIANEDVMLDLEIFEGLGLDKSNSIFKNLNRSLTKTGSFLLRKVLANPIDDLNLLQKRQNILHQLLQKPDLVSEIKNKLVKISKVEDDLLWFWRDLNQETQYLFNMVYFNNRFLRFLNTNELAMRIYNYYVIIFSPMYGIISPIIIF